MTEKIILNGREIRIERRYSEVYSVSPKPDPNWRFTDSQGHEHYYATGTRDRYPTLRLEFGETHWCSDCCDDHEESFWVCRQCREVIKPGARIGRQPQRIQTVAVEYFINGEPVNKEAVERLLEEFQSK